MGGQNSKYKSALAVIDAVTKFVKEIPAIDGDSLSDLFLSFNKARSAFLTEEIPAPIQRKIDEFMTAAIDAFIQNRALAETKNARERELLERRQAEEFARLSKVHTTELDRIEKERKRAAQYAWKAHCVAFVVALFLATYAWCIKSGAFLEAIYSVCGVATSLGVGGWFYKTAKREESGSVEKARLI